MTVKLYERNEYVTAKGRADDGSDKSIVSTKLTYNAVLNVIGNIFKNLFCPSESS